MAEIVTGLANGGQRPCMIQTAEGAAAPSLHQQPCISNTRRDLQLSLKSKMPQTRVDFADKQGGKKFGMLKKEQEDELNRINKEFLEDDTLKELEDLEEKLTSYKAQFMEFDLDHSGDIDIMELKQMLEKLGQAKTHMELKKMIKEVDTVGHGTISYRDFVNMMLGTKTSVLKLILMFEEKKKEKAKPVGPPPKKSITDLP